MTPPPPTPVGTKQSIQNSESTLSQSKQACSFSYTRNHTLDIHFLLIVSQVHITSQEAKHSSYHSFL